MRLFVIIPARAGSVGVPSKNIAIVGGRPLLLHTYAMAQSLPGDPRIIVSTDSQDYINLACGQGHKDPLLRPAELSQSNSLVIDTILYELDRAAARAEDMVLILEPSFVGARRMNIVEALNRLKNDQADSCFGVVRVPAKYHYAKQVSDVESEIRFVGNSPNINRQSLSTAYIRSGQFYSSRVNLVRNERSLFGGRISVFETRMPFVNIDDEEDLVHARAIAGSYDL